MQAILCDVCERPIRGKALELQRMWGEAVSAEEGRPRVVSRGQSGLLFLCNACGVWVEQAIAHLGKQTRLLPGPASV